MRKSDMLEPSAVMLGKGHALFAQLARGTVLRCVSGELVLIQHLALEQGLLSMPTPITRGAVYCMADTAWVELRAQADAQVLVLSPSALRALPLLRQGVIRLQAWIAVAGKLAGFARA